MPHEHENELGAPLVLAGAAEAHTAPSDSWVIRSHPLRGLLLEDDARQRASYLATRRALMPYLEGHRFEGNKAGPELRRSRIGYGVGLNRAYLQEILGHVRGAAATYHWGPMSEAQSDKGETGRPEGGIARLLWEDVDRKGKSWRTFFERDVLERMLTSPGGVVVCDASDAVVETRAEETRSKARPFATYAGVDWLEDWGRGPTGYRWVKFREWMDERGPRDANSGSPTLLRLVYELGESDSVLATRYDDKGREVGDAVDMGEVLDFQGTPTLPIVTASYGEHPDVPYFGAGLLMGLEDIIIDMYNLMSEMREGYRDLCFGILTYTGPDGGNVQKLLEQGTRYADLGDEGKLDRLAADSAEVAAGISLLELAIFAWALSAKRKAAEAQERAQAKSGIALQAEFQLDLKPLLVEVTETLDEVETRAMFTLGQLAGYSANELSEVRVVRNTDFRLEDEGSRIARIVAEWVDTQLKLPATVRTELVLSWLDKSELVDLEAEVDVDGAGTSTKRDAIRQELERLNAAEDDRAARPAEAFPGFGL